ncbi:MAG: helix-turn-helix domain-containing protein [Rickettsiales bacterium]
MKKISSKESIKEAIGARVKLWRRNNGLSQESLADSLGCSASRLSKIENGTQLITTEQLFNGFSIGWNVHWIVTGQECPGSELQTELQGYLQMLSEAQQKALVEALKILSAIGD